MSLYYILPYNRLKKIRVGYITCFIPTNGTLFLSSTESYDEKPRIYLEYNVIETNDLTISAIKHILQLRGFVSIPYLTGGDDGYECSTERMKEKLSIEEQAKNRQSRLSMLPTDVRIGFLSKYMPKYKVYAVNPPEEESGNGISIFDYDVNQDRIIGQPIFRLRRTDTLPEVKLGNKLYIISYTRDTANNCTIYEFNSDTGGVISYIIPYTFDTYFGKGSQTMTYNNKILIYNMEERNIIIYDPNTQFTIKKMKFPKKVIGITYMFDVNGVLWFYCFTKKSAYLFKTIDYRTGQVEEIDTDELPEEQYVPSAISYREYIIIVSLIKNNNKSISDVENNDEEMYHSKIFIYDTINNRMSSIMHRFPIRDIVYDDIGLFTRTNGPSLYLIGDDNFMYTLNVGTMIIEPVFRRIHFNIYTFVA